MIKTFDNKIMVAFYDDLESFTHHQYPDYEDHHIKMLEFDPEYHMGSAEIVFTLVYFLLGLCLVAPPTEFIHAGLTIQNVLANYLGSEEMNFIYYHIKRSTATALFHSIIPLCYYVGMGLFAPHFHLFEWWRMTWIWRLYLIGSILLVVSVVTLTYYWSLKRWANHPIAQTLKYHTTDSSSWQPVASSINIEFRRITKFASGPPGRRVIVTDSWVMLTSTYTVYIAQQQDIHLSLVASEEHYVTPEEGTAGAQFLNINIATIRDNVKSFTIRLNALEYSDLREKLSSPIRNARNIVIHQSLSERFLVAFREQIDSNPTVRKTPSLEVEQCIGCMAILADVKLQKRCHNEDEGDCRQCYCRPMWCLSCMGKWFAHRQDQGQQDTWLSGKAPCPTCRSTFCMLDVCRIV